MSRGGGPEHRFVKAIHPSALNGDLRRHRAGRGDRAEVRQPPDGGLQPRAAVRRRDPRDAARLALPRAAARARADDGLARRARAGRRTSACGDATASSRSSGRRRRSTSSRRAASARVRRAGPGSRRSTISAPSRGCSAGARPASIFRVGTASAARSSALQAERPDEFAGALAASLHVGAAALRAEQRRHVHRGGRPRRHARLRRPRRGRARAARTSSALIAREFERTSLMLERIYRGTLAERRPNIHATVQMRQAAAPRPAPPADRVAARMAARQPRGRRRSCRRAPPAAPADRQRHRQRAGGDGIDKRRT